ncbi:MAG: tetratricopeptide repeat protein [Duncaniella sp.]|uniref:tetratricopeptide repeat protein n=1 Tax=Duncaniella sp. TaxID=2518496 RepID=UPI0023C45004|nr:tetratricopeptide repeat protein [Duncaniella sp.]MDE6090251.1 tetratricopeptide repeat protein [Duncaniella sp.]
MNHHIDISKDIERLLSQRRVNDALDLIDNAAATLGASPELRSATSRLRESYRFMTHYALKGMPDPARPELYASILADIRTLADELHRRSRLEDAPTLYFNTLRYQRMRPDINIASLLDEYRRVNRRLQMAMLTEDVEKAGKEFTQRAEDLEKQIFNQIWTTYPLSVDDAAAIGALLTDISLPRHFKQLVVSSVMLGQMEYPDEKRLRLLMDAYGSDDSELSVRALCSLLIVMSMQRDRPFSPSLVRRFDSLREMPGWNKDVKMALLQFIRARDTERIGRKLTDEVIPEMMKLQPELEKLGSMPVDPESMEENPEWAELIDKSGVADKLKELQEIQEDGGDVMMVTFSKLKTFPFFNDIANWFLPFHTDHSLIAGSNDASVRMLADVIGGAPVFCNSDKYSVILSLSQVPEAQKQMMSAQLKANSAQMAAMSMGDLDQSLKGRERMAGKYVQDIYRFFRLFRRKGEFSDPFATTLNLVTVPLLADIFDDTDTLLLVGEFYFRHRHFADAFDVFLRLSEKVPPTAQLYQKMGYCMQMLGAVDKAIMYYEQSELLNSESRWTIRRLANCYRNVRDWKKAVEYYSRIAAAEPDDAAIAQNLALCHLEAGQISDAVNLLHKVEFLQGESDRTSRPLVRCALLEGDIEKGRRYSGHVLSRDPSATDFLNAGHLEILSGNLDEGVRRYAESIAADNFEVGNFVRTMREDMETYSGLKAIDPLTLGLIFDEAILRSASLGHKV